MAKDKKKYFVVETLEKKFAIVSKVTMKTIEKFGTLQEALNYLNNKKFFYQDEKN
jgi:hypothetical protein